MNPDEFIFDDVTLDNAGVFVVKYALPYVEYGTLSQEGLEQCIRDKELTPPIPLDNYAQMDHPDESQTSGNYERCQMLGVCDMALVQIEAPALLVGAESLDTKAFGIPIAGFF